MQKMTFAVLAFLIACLILLTYFDKIPEDPLIHFCKKVCKSKCLNLRSGLKITSIARIGNNYFAPYEHCHHSKSKKSRQTLSLQAFSTIGIDFCGAAGNDIITPKKNFVKIKLD